MPDNFRTLSKVVIKALAFNIPIYREIYSRFGGALVSLFLKGDSKVYEAFIRAYTLDSRQFKPKYIGRNITFLNKHNIFLGEDSILYGFNYLDAGEKGFIHIGNKTHIDVFSVLYGQGKLSIGNNCAIAAGVRIYSQTNEMGNNIGILIIDTPRVYSQVVIGNNVWIGTGATILPGVSIGDNSVVAAGAVVKTSFARNSVIGGTPAKLLYIRQGKQE